MTAERIGGSRQGGGTATPGDTCRLATISRDGWHGTVWRRTDRGLRLRPGMGCHVRARAKACAGRPRVDRRHGRARRQHGGTRPCRQPIIDLLVGVRSLPAARSCCTEPLQALRYTHMAEYESWLPGEMLFRKGVPGPWTHHVHLMEASSPRWEEFILIRDYLRGHAQIASAYGNLKRALALVFDDDIAGYRNAKGPFLKAVLAKARADR